MTSAATPSSAPTDPGRAAWQELSSIAGGTDTLVESVESLADDLAHLFQRLEEPNAILPSVRAQVIRELAAASARLHQAATRLQMGAVVLVENESVHLADAVSTTRKWVARHHGLSHQAASALCRSAATAERFPIVGTAFHEGDITAGHLDAVGNIIPSRFKGEDRQRAIAKVTDIQGILVTTAAKSTVDEFIEFCDQVRRKLDEDGPKPAEADASRIWLHKLFNGRFSLTGDLSADDGALVATILADIRSRRAKADAAADAERPEGEPAPTFSEHTARDLVDLLLAGNGADGPGRAGIIIHIDLADLNAGDGGLDDVMAGRRPAHTEAGFDISDDTFWALLANADVIPVFNRNGTSLWYGRTRRLAPPMLRRVLAHRDRRCRFPGCDRPPIWDEIHHIREWDADQGETDPENCMGDCKFHHHATHDRGFLVSGNANGILKFTRPDGTPYDVTPLYKRRKAS